MTDMTDVLVIQPSQKVGKSDGSTSMNNDWVFNCALLGYTNVTLILKNHLVKEWGVESQSRSIDFEALPIDLIMFQNHQ